MQSKLIFRPRINYACIQQYCEKQRHKKHKQRNKKHMHIFAMSFKCMFRKIYTLHMFNEKIVLPILHLMLYGMVSMPTHASALSTPQPLCSDTYKSVSTTNNEKMKDVLILESALRRHERYYVYMYNVVYSRIFLLITSCAAVTCFILSRHLQHRLTLNKDTHRELNTPWPTSQYLHSTYSQVFLLPS